MKVRICYTVEASDELRRAFNHRYGQPGLATREKLKSIFRHNGTLDAQSVLAEYREEEAQKYVLMKTFSIGYKAKIK